MDSNKVYKKDKGKVLRKEEGKVQPSITHEQYRDKNHQTHHANLHFVSNGKIIETIEEDDICLG